MCKKVNNKYIPNTRIDKCLKPLMLNLKHMINPDKRICASCCGHGRYPLSILVKDKYGNVWDIVSNTIIPRKRNFYKRDSKGYYYIPEVQK